MEADHGLAIYRDFLLVLVTAGVIVPVMQRLRVTPVLGYLAAGIVLGPHGLGLLAKIWPALETVVIRPDETLTGLADLGVVFLLFIIGLELSASRLMRMRRLVFGLGGLQVVTAASAIALLAPLFGAGAEASILIGLSLALSSTAVVLEWLSQRGRLHNPAGRASFAVLLFQDLAVVPILFLVGILARQDSGSLAVGLLSALGLAAVTIVLILIAGSLLLSPLFRLVAGAQSQELFIAATLLVAVGTGVITAAAGLSMALGGFLAGLLLAETEYRRAIEAAIGPFKGLLLGVFFILVGTRIDASALIANPLVMLSSAVGVILLKAGLFYPLARLFGLPTAVAAETALLLGPCGEFAFIILGIGSAAGVIDPAIAGTLLAVVALTMVAIPALGYAGERIARSFEDRPLEPAAPEHEREDVRVIVVGAGRVGSLVSEMLGRHGVPHLLTDRDPNVIRRHRRQGRLVSYGDAKNDPFLRCCGVMEARAIVITINAQPEIDEIVEAVRAMRPDIDIIVRARDAEHARRLYAEGVTDAVPETIEASLQLSEAALVALGVPTGPVIASIHAKRDAIRHSLQGASTNGAGIVRALRFSDRAPASGE